MLERLLIWYDAIRFRPAVAVAVVVVVAAGVTAGVVFTRAPAEPAPRAPTTVDAGDNTPPGGPAGLPEPGEWSSGLATDDWSCDEAVAFVDEVVATTASPDDLDVDLLNDYDRARSTLEFSCPDPAYDDVRSRFEAWAGDGPSHTDRYAELFGGSSATDDGEVAPGG
jgi:hypothetical protein